MDRENCYTHFTEYEYTKDKDTGVTVVKEICLICGAVVNIYEI